MRIPLATELVSRDGTVDQDAQLKNCFVEGDQTESAIFRRPGVGTADATASGQAQGMISFNSLVYAINGDVVKSYNSSFTLQETITL